MVFTTWTFLIFFLIVFHLYWFLSRQGQNILLLISSLIFYGWWDWRFVPLMLTVAGLDYFVALKLMRTERPLMRKVFLGVSLLGNLGTLALFKYFNFFSESFRLALGELGFRVDPVTIRVILPVGISFYTFQALSYTIDVYRREMPAVRSIVQYFAFITYFPQLVAGPIERAKNLLGQFEQERRFDLTLAIDGTRQMLWGFFIKMAIADNIAEFVNATYANVGIVGGWALFKATCLFAIQIYCDFAGYTHIAIGCASLFGFKLMRNFAYPYFSTSIPEFWRRWHISLSTWFRDYLYLPLGGNRVSRWRWYRNVLVVFLVSGFWHGANWTFVMWGLLHAIFFLAYVGFFTDRSPNKSSMLSVGANVLQMGLCFGLVCLTWVFFRAASIQEAGIILEKISHAMLNEPFSFYLPKQNIVCIGLLFGIEWWNRKNENPLQLSHCHRLIRWGTYYALFLMILLYAPLSASPFIYFQW